MTTRWHLTVGGAGTACTWSPGCNEALRTRSSTSSSAFVGFFSVHALAMPSEIDLCRYKREYIKCVFSANHIALFFAWLPAMKYFPPNLEPIRNREIFMPENDKETTCYFARILSLYWDPISNWPSSRWGNWLWVENTTYSNFEESENRRKKS